MYAKGFIVSLLICISGFIGVQQPDGVTEGKVNPTRIYESGIIQKIENCESQAELLHNSRSASLQRYAQVQDNKAQFWYVEQEMLVDLMIQKRLEPRQYRIAHFLEDQFYRSIAKK
jgi:hypothetical protein